MQVEFLNERGGEAMNSDTKAKGLMRLLMWVSIAVLILTTIPLYAISFYNHPYYDDYNFSASVHQMWNDTNRISDVLAEAVRSSQTMRQEWQGTYTGTFLSNIQPGVFSESLYFISTFVLLSAFILCFGYFFYVVFAKRLGVDKRGTIMLSAFALTLLIQFTPDVGEAFYWFNGGIGNTFIYSLLALSLALSLNLMGAKTKGHMIGITIALALFMVLLGGGSYGGGLFGLCLYTLVVLWLFHKKDRRAWIFAGLWALFLACFVYNMSATGNQVRAGVIGAHSSAIGSIVSAIYNGIAQIGSYIRLPIIAISLLIAPLFYNAAKGSDAQFKHPWITLALMTGLYCTQLVPPIFGGVGIGGGRIVNTYFQSFVVMWFIYLYYFLGHIARKTNLALVLPRKSQHALILLTACLLVIGCMGFKQPDDKYYGAQNMAGASAALSIVNGEAAQYHHEMQVREAALNDSTTRVVTLAPLTVVPSVFMDDLITVDAVYDARPSLCRYYDKDAIIIEGEGF